MLDAVTDTIVLAESSDRDERELRSGDLKSILSTQPTLQKTFCSNVRMLSGYEVDPSHLVFLTGLKLSMSQRIRSAFPDGVRSRATALRQVLEIRHECTLSSPELAHVLLDEGLCSRVEFRLPPGVSGNSHWAYYGDACLTKAIASCSLRAGNRPREWQFLRSSISSRVALYTFYDHYFSTRPFEGPLTWESVLRGDPPTGNQRAEFIEALIGYLDFHDRRCCVRFIRELFLFFIRRSDIPALAEVFEVGF